MFNGNNWKEHFEPEDYKRFPLQLKKLIGIRTAELQKTGESELKFPARDSKCKGSKITKQIEVVDSALLWPFSNN